MLFLQIFGGGFCESGAMDREGHELSEGLGLGWVSHRDGAIVAPLAAGTDTLWSGTRTDEPGRGVGTFSIIAAAMFALTHWLLTISLIKHVLVLSSTGRKAFFQNLPHKTM